MNEKSNTASHKDIRWKRANETETGKCIGMEYERHLISMRDVLPCRCEVKRVKMRESESKRAHGYVRFSRYMPIRDLLLS